MNEPCSYRGYLQSQLTSLGLPSTLEHVLQWAEGTWNDERFPIGTRIFGGVGLLAFGRKEHLSSLVALMVTHPGAMRAADARAAVGELRQILPIPEDVIAYKNPAALKTWVADNYERLQWEDPLGRFILLPK